MSYKNILLEAKDQVGILTVNRPKVLNALNPETLQEMEQALQEVQSSEEIRVLVLTGAGEKAFVAGADISEFPKMNALQARLFARKGQEIFADLEELPIPTVACVNGFALGGGLELAMSCDFIYASEQAKVGQPEINLGVIPGFGGTQRLARLIGPAKAKELCMTGEQITAQQAKELGLVAEVFPSHELWDKTLEKAGAIAAKGSVALRGVKEAINYGLQTDLKTACLLEAQTFAACFASSDAQEGAQAFLEKRKPEFKGSFTS
ncbi:MAG: enoyl-CoA hydratase/isomerase family protein [Desulfohalobiaceae bacterium]